MNDSKVNTIVEGFLQYLKKGKNLALLPEIINELEQRREQTNASAIVYSSEKLLKDQEEKVAKAISANFGIVKVQFEVEPSLMGGIKVKIGDQVLDLSLQHKLDTLVESI